MGANVDHRLANSRDGVYTFKICGQLSHVIGKTFFNFEKLQLSGDLQPVPNNEAKFCQIYFLDSQMQAQRRVDLFNGDISVETITTLQNVLDEINPYVAVFKQAREVYFIQF